MEIKTDKSIASLNRVTV